MKIIRCQNVYRDSEGKDVKCGRILVILTDLQCDILKIDTEEGMIVRCPKCHPEQRWARISYDKEKNGLKFSVLDKNPDLSQCGNLKFEALEICQQVG